MRGFVALLVTAWLAGPAVAGVTQSSACVPSPRIAAPNYPGARNVPSMNDLTRYSGKAVSAQGQRLLLQGRVVDANCLPVDEAVVELWQADPYGKWYLATGEDKVSPRANFNGAGRAITDNNGRFSFITLFPAQLKGQAPRLNLLVKAPHMQDFSTILYFEDDMRNASDPVFKRLTPANQQRVQLDMSPLNGDVKQGFVGMIELVLPGKARYRSY